MPFHSPKSLPGLQNIKDERVLAAMLKIDRSHFVPDDMVQYAYEDRALPIGHGQSISQPYIVALMTQLLELQGTENVLEIGTGSGYQAAILGELAKEVYSIEIIPELAEAAKRRLEELGYKNVYVRLGDGYQGWPEMAPFDAIIVTCSPDHIPQPLIDQLKEGGRLVIPVGVWPHEQMLHQLQKVGGELVRHPVIPVSFVPMTGELK
jgi:protein-L-isoaspartate(D-aspartate) O-methyltransferase